MKKRHLLIKLLVLISIVFSCFSLSGCASIKSLIKANLSGLPYWVFSPTTALAKERVSFVGEGHSSNARQAELLAYSNIVEQIEERIGVSLGQETYRELSVLGTITAYNLSVVDSFSRTIEREVVYYVYAIADAKLLEEASSEETLRKNEIKKNVEELVLEGDEYVKNEMFTKGISCYMKAMALSYGQDYIKDEYSYMTLYEDVMDILKSLTMALVSQNETLATCTVSLTRESVLFPSRVKNASIVASYRAVDMRSIEYDDSFVYSTDSTGSFEFDCLNFSMVRKGSIKFSLDFETELKALEVLESSENATGEQAASSLRETIEEKSVTFNYDRRYNLRSIAVAVMEFDSKGYAIGNTSTTDYVCSLFKDNSAVVTPYYATSLSEEDILYDYMQTSNKMSCILICRIGQLATVESSLGEYAVSMEGIASLFSTHDGSQIYTSSIIYATAFGETIQDATKAAYEKFADLTYSLLKAEYV